MGHTKGSAMVTLLSLSDGRWAGKRKRGSVKERRRQGERERETIVNGV